MTSTQDFASATTQFDLVAYLTDRQPQIEAALDAAVPPAYPDKIYESMRYSLLAGGKRLRPILCLASCELIGDSHDVTNP
jgi:geranylgeranyl diphosphate synthase, type II